MYVFLGRSKYTSLGQLTAALMCCGPRRVSNNDRIRALVRGTRTSTNLVRHGSRQHVSVARRGRRISDTGQTWRNSGAPRRLTNQRSRPRKTRVHRHRARKKQPLRTWSRRAPVEGRPNAKLANKTSLIRAQIVKQTLSPQSKPKQYKLANI